MPYHPKKPYHLCRKSVAPDPLVDPGNPPHRHQARPPARSARPHHRMVVVAACPPGPSSSCPSQAGIPHKKNATVMLDGFVAKYLGDGLVVHFGYPQAHGNDAEHAVRAGLAIIELVTALNDNLAKKHSVSLS